MTIPNISTASIAVMFINVFICFGIPLALYILIRKRLKAKPIFFLCGCICFILFVIILENMMHQAVLFSSIGGLLQSNTFLFALYGGLAAGIFEEVGRFIFLSFLIKKDDAPANSLMFGAGHGGIEAIILVGTAYINNIYYSILVNKGQLEAALSSLDEFNRSSLEYALLSLSQYPPLALLAAGFERILAIALHIGLTVIVFTAIKKKKPIYLLLAIALHSLVDAVAVVLTDYFSVAILEVAVLIMVVFIGLYASKLYKKLSEAETAEI